MRRCSRAARERGAWRDIRHVRPGRADGKVAATRTRTGIAMPALLPTLALFALLAASPDPHAGGVAPAETVGTVGIVVHDPARRDGEAPRSWRVALYYPAQAGTGIVRPYAGDPALLAHMAEAGYYDVDRAAMEAWARQPAPAREHARALPGRLPLVTLSPGSGVAAFHYSELASAIARRGYAVAVVEHPGLGLSLGTDGRIASAADDPLLQREDPAEWQPRIRDWIGDLSATLDALPGHPAVRAAGIALDPTRVVAVGHSLGGTVALEACSEEPRLSACADFDGVVEGTRTYAEGPRRPTLLLLGRSLKPERPLVAPDLGKPPFDFLARGGRDDGWAVAIGGGSHMSFSDAPREMPDTLSRFGGTLMDAGRSEQVYAGIVDAFARAFLPGGGGNAALEAFFRDIPEARAVHAAGR
jgi:dienelactone hydrolase